MIIIPGTYDMLVRAATRLSITTIALCTLHYSYQSLREIWTRMLQYAEYPPQAIADFLAAQGRDAAVLPPHEVAAIVESSGFDRSVLFMQTLLIHAWYARRS
jgi:tRNA (cmo5U34)-methyltransferase